MVNRTALTKAFKQMRKHNLIARQNYWDCSSCALAASDELIEKEQKKNKNLLGFVYYHAQDREHMMEGGNLMIRFFPIMSEEMNIGGFVMEILKINGLKVKWNGDASKCIEVLSQD